MLEKLPIEINLSSMNKYQVCRRLLLAASSSILLSSLSSCVPLAIGAAGGYILNEQGYRVQSPVTKKPVNYDTSYQTPAYQEPSYQAAPTTPTYSEY